MSALPPGAQLRRLRFAMGLTLQQVAGRVGAGAANTVHHWELSRNNPTPEHRRRLAELFGVDVYATDESAVAS